MESQSERVEPTPQLYKQYCTYVQQRKNALGLAPTDSEWRLQEPPEFSTYEAFAKHWQDAMSPLMHRDFAAHLETGWKGLSVAVKALSQITRKQTEQVMQIAQTLAGYTLGGADVLRRAMGKKKPEEMAKQHEIFVKGCIEHSGMTKEQANEIIPRIKDTLFEDLKQSHIEEKYKIILSSISF